MTEEFDDDSIVFPMRPSPYDGRDYILEDLHPVNLVSTTSKKSKKKSATRSPFPETLDLRPWMTTPRNQGLRGTCAAFSASAIKEYQERIDVNYLDYMSPESIYFYRENKDQEGMYGRNVMKILYYQGIAPELFFPYGTMGNPDEIPTEAEKEMEKYRIREYAQVRTIEGCKQALCTYGPLLICLPAYRNSPEFWKPRDAEDNQRGGHAVAIVGYNEDGFILRNSWGSKWNGDGHVIFPYQDFGIHWEIWSSIDDESPTLPPELDPNHPDYKRLKLIDAIMKIFMKMPCLKSN